MSILLPPHDIPEISNKLRSPSYAVGRGDNPVKYFIRHNTETRGDSNAPSLSWFVSPQSGVSIHHLIARNGTRFDLVQRSDTAYHCGTSAWGEDKGTLVVGTKRVGAMNVLSIGVEFESQSTIKKPGNGYTDEQLWSGAYTEACSIVSYPDLIVLDHKQIALPEGRRHDPSNFPYEIYLDYVSRWVTFLQQSSDSAKGRWCV